MLPPLFYAPEIALMEAARLCSIRLECEEIDVYLSVENLRAIEACEEDEGDFDVEILRHMLCAEQKLKSDVFTLTQSFSDGKALSAQVVGPRNYVAGSSIPRILHFYSSDTECSLVYDDLHLIFGQVDEKGERNFLLLSRFQLPPMESFLCTDHLEHLSVKFSQLSLNDDEDTRMEFPETQEIPFSFSPLLFSSDL